jgi:cell division protein FtsZ
VVTKPFAFEGDKRMKRAMEGIESMKKNVDTLIIIPNERLKSLGSKNSTFRELITRADDVLLHAVKGISDLIMSTGFINLDFADVKKVMEQSGTAIMGSGRASGENRALEAAKEAVNSPLLEDISIKGARGLLMNVTGSPDMTMDEIDEASNYIKGEVDGEAEILWGVVFDESMESDIQITVIATGIDKDRYDKVVRLRDVTPQEAEEAWAVRKVRESEPDLGDFDDPDDLESPAYLRKERNAQLKRVESASEKKKGFLKKGFFKDNLDIPTFLRAGQD